jgi:hypothetical protein
MKIDSDNYHTREVYDDEYNIIGEEYILHERGEPIPRTICICAAHSVNECCCGAWDVDIEDDD